MKTPGARTNEKKRHQRPGRGKPERYIQPSLLRALAEQDAYGYELMKIIPDYGFVTEDVPPGMIYRHLRQMEEEGLLTSAWQTEDSGPAKRIYGITDQGRRALAQWVEHMRDHGPQDERLSWRAARARTDRHVASAADPESPLFLDSKTPVMVADTQLPRGLHEAHQRGPAVHAGRPQLQDPARILRGALLSARGQSSFPPWRRPTRCSSSRADGCASIWPRTSRSSPWPSWNGATSIPPTPGPTWPPWTTAPLWVTDTARFHASLADHPDLAGAMINVLGGLLKNSMSIISGLVFNDVARRLVEYLLAEARAGGERDGNGILIRLDLTTEQVAQIVGSTRQTVSVLINDLVRARRPGKGGARRIPRARHHPPGSSPGLTPRPRASIADSLPLRASASRPSFSSFFSIIANRLLFAIHAVTRKEMPRLFP